MRALLMLIIGLVFVSCTSIKRSPKFANDFQEVINTYRIKHYVRPLKWNCDLAKVTSETIDTTISQIHGTHSSDTTTAMIKTMKTHRVITLPICDGEATYLDYIDGLKFDTLGVDLYKTKGFADFVSNNFPSAHIKSKISISVGAKIGKNTYDVNSNIANGIYNYNGVTIKVKDINGKKILWSEGNTSITKRTITCLKLNTLDKRTKEEIKYIYILNKMIKNPKFKSTILDAHVKSMSYRIALSHSFVLCVVNVQ